MDIIYDPSIFNIAVNHFSCILPNTLTYIQDMSTYITDVSHDIYHRVISKTIDAKIKDVLDISSQLSYVSPISLSAVILCFNEERCIERCIRSLSACLFDEIIVIDTGSSDHTLEILVSLQNDVPSLCVHHFVWNDNFSEVRNYALSLVKSEWVFFIDADEYYINDASYSIKDTISFFSIYDDGALCLCPTIINNNNHQLYNNPRIFKKSIGYRYYGCIHETLRLKTSTYEFVPHIGVNIKLGHDGYESTVYSQKNKQIRNVNLLFKNIDLEPNNPLWKCYLIRDGLYYLDQETLINLCHDAIRLSQNRTSYFFSYNYYWAHLMLIDFYIYIKQPDKIPPLLDVVKNNTLNLDESDIFYREQLTYMLNMEKSLYDKLEEVKSYRQQHLSTEKSALNTEGYHLDDLIMRLHYLNHNMDEYQRYQSLLYDLHYFA